MSEFKNIPLRALPKFSSLLTTPEANYWASDNWFRVLSQLQGAVTSINFSPVAPHPFAVTSGKKVSLFDPHTKTPSKNFAKHHDVVYSGTFRQDGQLVVMGDEKGVVRVYDPTGDTPLRIIEAHTKAVHLTRFCTNVSIMSGSDDMTLASTDVSSAQVQTVLKGHEDHVRCGVVSASNPSVWVSGSYDHTVKVWDVRTGKSILSFDHGAPVEDLLLYPTGTVIVSAGGNRVKVWDIFKGQLLTSLEVFQKTVTSLALDPKRRRLITGSLDCNLTIFSTADFTVLHSMNYSSPLLSVALSPAGTHLVAGMSDGTLSIMHRITPSKPQKFSSIEGKKELIIDVKSSKKRLHSSVVEEEKAVRPPTTTTTTAHRKAPKDTLYEYFLRRFQYKKALDYVLANSTFEVIVSVIDELILREALEIAVSGRDEITLAPLLRFLCRRIRDFRVSKTLILVAQCVLDLYAPIIGKSESIDSLFRTLHRQVSREIAKQKQLLQTLGALDTIINFTNLLAK